MESQNRMMFNLYTQEKKDPFFSNKDLTEGLALSFASASQQTKFFCLFSIREITALEQTFEALHLKMDSILVGDEYFCIAHPNDWKVEMEIYADTIPTPTAFPVLITGQRIVLYKL